MSQAAITGGSSCQCPFIIREFTFIQPDGIKLKVHGTAISTGQLQHRPPDRHLLDLAQRGHASRAPRRYLKTEFDNASFC